MKRGDLVLVRFPHPSGQRGKKRPAVVVQSDIYATAVSTVVVAEVTKNLAAASDPTSVFIDISTPEGKATGLDRDSVVGCLFLATISEQRITKLIGKLSDAMMQQLNGCLKAALELP